MKGTSGVCSLEGRGSVLSGSVCRGKGEGGIAEDWVGRRRQRNVLP